MSLLPMTSECRHRESTLLSDKYLPVKPSPTPSSTEGLVPNIVHYVSLGCERMFSFANYLSVLSVHKFVDPDRIYFHCDCPPVGLWWERTLLEVPDIYFRKHRRQRTIQGRPPMWIEHETDVIRLQILLGNIQDLIYSELLAGRSSIYQYFRHVTFPAFFRITSRDAHQCG